MLIENNVNLKQYTTIKIGGIAENYYIPESKEELLELLKVLETKKEEFKILAGGSNLLINDKKLYKHVIYTSDFNREFIVMNNGRFFVGASVKLQQLILKLNRLGYGGIEYLFSVPGTVGGAVTMNAGRGKKYNQCLSDYILEVQVLCDGVLVNIPKSECFFSYRDSIFKKNQMIVVGVLFCFPKMDPQKSKLLREERIRLCKEKQDTSRPNFGSLLKKGNRFAFTIMRKLQLGYKGGVHFSPKCNNWLINDGNGTFNQVLNIIRVSKIIHLCFFCNQELEVIIWY